MPGAQGEFIVLTTSRREFDAAAIAEALHSHRIEADVAHVETAPASPGTPAVREHRVLVRATDLKKARDLLPFIQAQSMHLSWASGPASTPSRPAVPARSDSPAPIDGPAPPHAVPASSPPPPAGIGRPHIPPHDAAAHAPRASRTVPTIVAVLVIVAFVAIVMAIIGRSPTP